MTLPLAHGPRARRLPHQAAPADGLVAVAQQFGQESGRPSQFRGLPYSGLIVSSSQSVSRQQRGLPRRSVHQPAELFVLAAAKDLHRRLYLLLLTAARGTPTNWPYLSDFNPTARSPL